MKNVIINQKGPLETHNNRHEERHDGTAALTPKQNIETRMFIMFILLAFFNSSTSTIGELL